VEHFAGSVSCGESADYVFSQHFPHYIGFSQMIELIIATGQDYTIVGVC
jgi:hypothetical protein